MEIDSSQRIICSAANPKPPRIGSSLAAGRLIADFTEASSRSSHRAFCPTQRWSPPVDDLLLTFTSPVDTSPSHTYNQLNRQPLNTRAPLAGASPCNKRVRLSKTEVGVKPVPRRRSRAVWTKETGTAEENEPRTQDTANRSRY